MSYSEKILALAALLFVAVSASAQAADLGLDAYLSQVEAGNVNIQAAKETSEGAALRNSEATLMYSPTLFLDFQKLNDHERNPMFEGAYEKIRTSTYTLGVRQLAPTGTALSVSYTLNSADYVPRPRFWEGAPRIEISQSLWRNGFGSETRANRELLDAGALATRYSESFRVKATRAEAESAYIRLAAARGLVQVFKDSVAQAKDLLDWSKRRTNLNLGENSDLYQAQANYEARQLSLQSALDEERSASREFNLLRQVDSDEVKETLVLPDLKNAQVPARAQIRDDVRAAREGARAAAAQAQLGVERNRPILEVYGAYAMNSRRADRGDAFSDSWKNDIPTSIVGVRFETPLFIGSQADAVKGYKKEKIAAQTLSDQKLFEQENEWKDLVLRLDEAKKRYGIAERLAGIQKKKVENERRQLRRGRTTTYQALIFDQDYNQAEAARIQAQSEVLTILARMKTFGGN